MMTDAEAFKIRDMLVRHFVRAQAKHAAEALQAEALRAAEKQVKARNEEGQGHG